MYGKIERRAKTAKKELKVSAKGQQDGEHGCRSRCFAVTDYDCSDIRLVLYKWLTGSSVPHCPSIPFQLEVCEKTGRMQLQLCLVFKHPQSINEIQAKLRYSHTADKGEIKEGYPNIEMMNKPDAFRRYLQKPASRVAGPFIYGIVPPRLEKLFSKDRPTDITNVVREMIKKNHAELQAKVAKDAAAAAQKNHSREKEKDNEAKAVKNRKELLTLCDLIPEEAYQYREKDETMEDFKERCRIHMSTTRDSGMPLEVMQSELLRHLAEDAENKRTKALEEDW